MNTLGQDLRYGLRLLVKQRGVTAVAVVSLALGIAANTLIFSIVYAVLLRSLGYKEPERLVVLWFTPPNRPDQNQGVSVANYLTLKEQYKVFEAIGALQFSWPVNLSAGPNQGSLAERAWGQKLSASLLETLGVHPVLGRWFTEADDQLAADPVVLISHRLWQRRYGGAPDILGKILRMDGHPTTIIGVMPPHFEFFNDEADFWLPFRFAPFNMGSRTRYLLALARLKPGQTRQQAQAEMNGVAAQLGQAFPETNKDWGIRLEPLLQTYVGWLREPILILQGAVAFVLLIACANVAGLLLAQASSRQKEIAVRSALGAGRWRVVRQVLTESMLLSTLGGALGVLLAYGGQRVFLATSPPFPRLREIAIDPGVLGFTALLTLVTGVIFGAAPALHASRPDLVESLKESSRGATAGLVRQRLRNALVVVQMALALVLLIGAGLLINSFLRLYSAQPGCDPRNLLTFQLRLARAEFTKDIGTMGGFHAIEISPRVPALFERIWQRLSGVPGVQSAAASMTPPLSGGSFQFGFSIEGRKPPASEKEALTAAYFPVSPGFFSTLGVPLLRGRDFTLQDSSAGPRAVIINQTMARRWWIDENPIGQRLRLDLSPDEKPRQIIGVVGDIRQNRYQQRAEAQMYVPYVQQPLPSLGRYAEPLLTMSYTVRAAGDPLRLVSALRTAVGEIDPSQPMFNIRTVEQNVSDQLREPLFLMTLLGIFGGIAVTLAAIGIYGVMAYSVSQRRHEIGIRMALGAGRGHVVKLVARQSLLLISLGTAAGLAASAALTRLMGSWLWGVTPTDPATFALVAIALISVALAACYVPARRATGVDPTVALRHE